MAALDIGAVPKYLSRALSPASLATLFAIISSRLNTSGWEDSRGLCGMLQQEPHSPPHSLRDSHIYHRLWSVGFVVNIC